MVFLTKSFDIFYEEKIIHIVNNMLQHVYSCKYGQIVLVLFFSIHIFQSISILKSIKNVRIKMGL